MILTHNWPEQGKTPVQFPFNARKWYWNWTNDDKNNCDTPEFHFARYYKETLSAIFGKILTTVKITFPLMATPSKFPVLLKVITLVVEIISKVLAIKMDMTEIDCSL